MKRMDGKASRGTKLWAGRYRVQIPEEARDLSLLQNNQTSSWTHPGSYSMATGALSLGIKQLGHETEHANPSSMKVKNQWCCTYTPLHTLMESIRTSPCTCWRIATSPCLRIIF